MLSFLIAALGLRDHEFRKCGDTPFCQQHRAHAPAVDTAAWKVDVPSITATGTTWSARLLTPDESQLSLMLQVSVLRTGAVRVHVADDTSVPVDSLEMVDPTVKKPEAWDDEMDGIWDAPRVRLGRAVKARYEPTEPFASEAALTPVACTELNAPRSRAKAEGQSIIKCSADAGPVLVRVVHEPFSVHVVDASAGDCTPGAPCEPVVSFNGRRRLLYEPFRQLIPSGEAEAKPPEPFKFNSFSDPMPFGSASVGVDIDFPHATHVYGLPERAMDLALPSTLGTEPYRLMNLDVFEYLLDHPMGLYGSVPFVQASGPRGSQGVLWLNPSETFVDVGCAAGGAPGMAPGGGNACTHWFSASGVIDAFLFHGASPTDVTRQHSAVTGVTPLPPYFALGYHQCRWNYRDEQDVRQVHEAFEEHALPFDVLWLDIEHTDGKRYFTWDKLKFPDPLTMQRQLKATGRNMVTIIDPHLKADDGYAVFADAKTAGLLVLKEDGEGHFEGDCWPGRSGWIDYLLPAAREYWAGQFAPDKYAGSSASLYTWNDMNEPSVERGPEVTMPMALVHRDGTGRKIEHRELHNLYGQLQHMATFAGQRAAYPQRRPFVLTRAFFAGSQRTAAVWTGDNKASWAHLAASTPMLLSLSLAGIPFVGADVGGFFGNPTPALLVRWYQVAVFHPFFRAHAEFKTKRREPYLFGDEVTRQVRTALGHRYSLLPYLYTLFAQHAADGSLVMRPLWYEFPTDPQLRGNAWWSAAAEERRAAAESKAAKTEAGAAAAAPTTTPTSDDELKRRFLEQEKAQAEAAAAAAGAAAGAAGGPRVLDEEAVEEPVDEGPCPCFKCDESRCWNPECLVCGTKAVSGCNQPTDAGCYTSAEAECSCNADPTPPPAYATGESDDDPDQGEGRGLGEDDADDAKGFDTRDEYYHGAVREGAGEQDENYEQTGEQFLLGPHIMVQPITTIKPIADTRVYLPASTPTADATWYDFYSHAKLVSTPSARVVTVRVQADHVPAFVRGGAIVPKRERLRRSSQATHLDPFTLVVAPDGGGVAAGTLFLDAYDGYEDTTLTAQFSYASGLVSGTVAATGQGGAPPAAESEVERIVLLGQAGPADVVVHRNGKLVPGVTTLYDAAAGMLTVRKPTVRVGEAWTVRISAP
jgi:alpha-glucosidase (family GH31 glycosyl hydrolase)